MPSKPLGKRSAHFAPIGSESDGNLASYTLPGEGADPLDSLPPNAKPDYSRHHPSNSEPTPTTLAGVETDADTEAQLGYFDLLPSGASQSYGRRNNNRHGSQVDYSIDMGDDDADSHLSCEGLEEYAPMAPPTPRASVDLKRRPSRTHGRTPRRNLWLGSMALGVCIFTFTCQTAVPKLAKFWNAHHFGY
ncbi:hypothetical protein BJ085DRAFT_33267 [Dimargaris cristalligena]|uniref:Uncharacterized protein n=1 Tax=Dimargaris cristalligena TaxID=215637 RepID=A0A4P9ZMZ7_9FUNG|nr:hypothetical protein BJ085DRAFT_33267 [Dimargaris cristalligena]|eukprot:RKP34633.1 hypothetical protein BJ085DRAFT_33267 [Dimargaris cristalligena]